jgi:hypothetical protein
MNSNKPKQKCLIQNALQIVQVVSNGEKYVRGSSELIQNLAILNFKQDDHLCIVSIE